MTNEELLKAMQHTGRLHIVSIGKETLREKLDRIAEATGGRSKPEDDWKEEQKLRRLR